MKKIKQKQQQKNYKEPQLKIRHIYDVKVLESRMQRATMALLRPEYQI